MKKSETIPFKELCVFAYIAKSCYISLIIRQHNR